MLSCELSGAAKDARRMENPGAQRVSGPHMSWCNYCEDLSQPRVVEDFDAIVRLGILRSETEVPVGVYCFSYVRCDCLDICFLIVYSLTLFAASVVSTSEVRPTSLFLKHAEP